MYSLANTCFSLEILVDSSDDTTVDDVDVASVVDMNNLPTLTWFVNWCGADEISDVLVKASPPLISSNIKADPFMSILFPALSSVESVARRVPLEGVRSR